MASQPTSPTPATDVTASGATATDVLETDVVVVGGGNAGFCAARAAREHGVRVTVLEKAPRDEAGGNSFYTAGAFRVAHGGAEALRPVLDHETLARLDATDLEPYPADAFEADMVRLTGGRSDPTMTRRLVTGSEDLVGWLAAKGIRWRLMYERQAYRSGDRWVFWGGLALGVVDGGKGLVAQHTDAALADGVDIRYGAAVTGLRSDDAGAIVGVTFRDADGHDHEVRAAAVVLAAGGFESDPARRRRHLGPGWEDALVRGTPHNTGEVLDLAIDAGAGRAGDWASCHSVAWDAGGPPAGGDRHLTNQRTRQSYPLGIVVNRDGARFLDEGADFRNYTYAKYGAEILGQPGRIAFQLFDARTRPLLRVEEYESEPITMVVADTLGELAAGLGIDPDGLARTVDEFNASIVDVPFDPAVKDGRAARVVPPKSNWANPLDQPPFHGYAVRCGITFTFGGVAIDSEARVTDESGRPIRGLYAAGELAGGLFSGNYPGGSGLTAGGVFGRIAGDHAAALAAEEATRAVGAP